MIPYRYRLIAIVSLLLVCLFGGYAWGRHEGSLHGEAALAQYKASQSQAFATAAAIAQQDQAKADAQTIANQRKALQDAQQATQQREAVIAAQDAKLKSMQATLHAISPSDKAAAAWLGPLPPSIRQALNSTTGNKP